MKLNKTHEKGKVLNHYHRQKEQKYKKYLEKIPKQKFGNKVREIRKEKGLSQEQLASLAGLDRSYMGHIERGEKNITLTKIYQIADALKVQASQLLS